MIKTTNERGQEKRGARDMIDCLIGFVMGLCIMMLVVIDGVRDDCIKRYGVEATCEIGAVLKEE